MLSGNLKFIYFTHLFSVETYGKTRFYFVIKASIALGHIIYTKITVLQRSLCPVKVTFNLKEQAYYLIGRPP